MPPSSSYRPSTAHAALGEAFFDVVEPAVFPRHILRHRNQRAAAEIGLDTLDESEWLDHFARFVPLPDSLAQPLALRYHGHQFRSYNPDLGDGRGFLFAQLHDSRGRLLDLGTKGSGRTPWSRGGDGRLTLKGGVREVLATELLGALGVDTSRSFSLVETGEELQRGDEPSPTRSAVLVRLSHSHIRIGSFQRLLYLDQIDDIARLVDHAIAHYLPEAAEGDAANRATRFLAAVCERVARTGARWMAAGFVHGVLNTDNINITGESFDYGPWRFLPVLDPRFTAAYFDQTGLYAFGRQPDALLWNLTRLAECLLAFAPQPALEAVLGGFERQLHRAFADAVVDRLGLAPAGEAADGALASALWTFLGQARPPFEAVFFDWHGGPAAAARALAGPRAQQYQSEAFKPVRAALDAHQPAPDARLDHPYFAGEAPTTLLIEEVEALWAPIAEDDDWRPLTEKLAQIAAMADAYRRG